MVCESMVEDQSEGSVSITAMSAQRDEYAPKVRKPYTITKQRERWTDEEHEKFLEALKLYGRAWRRIEEHVGNKTAVQIRSHAQKFFSKVVRKSSGSDGPHVEPIEIPPPRAKRKPTHPYPRKLSAPLKKQAYVTSSSSPNSSGSNQENQSPTSVLSVGGSETFATQSLHSECDLSALENGSPPGQENRTLEIVDSNFQKMESLSEEEKGFVKESSPEPTSTQSFKLFGKTVFVTVPHRSSPSSPNKEGQRNEMQKESQRKICVEDHQGIKKDECMKGFVPYKRCLAQENTGEDRGEQRARLCL